MADDTRSIWQRQHKRIPEDEKLRLGIRLNIYDAARSYKAHHGDTRGIRAIIKDDDFRNAWRMFRGGGLKRGKPTSFRQKMAAARHIGWAPPQEKAIERLRNTSP